jgi:hypothetical protein
MYYLLVEQDKRIPTIIGKGILIFLQRGINPRLGGHLHLLIIRTLIQEGLHFIIHRITVYLQFVHHIHCAIV